MKANWNEALESGNETIDSQHRDLFNHINTYFDSLEKVYGHEITIKTLNYLLKYVRFHFGTEEELMKRYGYPDFSEHLTEHRKLVDELMNCYKSLISDGHSEEIVERLRILLNEWLVAHIMGYDMKLAEFMKENGFNA